MFSLWGPLWPPGFRSYHSRPSQKLATQELLSNFGSCESSTGERPILWAGEKKLCLWVCVDAALWQCMAFWWICLCVLKPSDPVRPVLDHCSCKDASPHSPQRQPGPVFFLSWHLLSGPSCIPMILSTSHCLRLSVCMRVFLYEKKIIKKMCFCFLREMKLFSCKHIFSGSDTSICYHSEGRCVYVWVNIFCNDRFIDKPTRPHLLKPEDESAGACKFPHNIEGVPRDQTHILCICAESKQSFIHNNWSNIDVSTQRCIKIILK